MKTILITGANGQLGNEIKEISGLYNFIFIFTDVDDLDITNIGALDNFFHNNHVDHIVNCAAYTAVDKAEDEPDKADLLNNIAVSNLVNISKKYNVRLIHISTDYVFNGKAHEPYKEDHKTNPASVYGSSKLKGEEAIINSNIEYLIIRTSWLYSSFGNNFVKTMLRLGKEKNELKIIFDQIGTPCYAYDLANAILTIINKTETKQSEFVSGIYNYSNEGICSWYDFAKEIFSISGIPCKVLPIKTKDYPTAAARPSYSVLDKNKIKSTFGIEIPHWKESIVNCLKIIK